jgi:hypothetical protein
MSAEVSYHMDERIDHLPQASCSSTLSDEHAGRDLPPWILVTSLKPPGALIGRKPAFASGRIAVAAPSVRNL